MIPKFPEFKNLELSDKVEIETITKQFPPYSDFHFTEMWCWDIHEPALLSKLNDNLVVKQTDCLTGKPFYSIIGTKSISETIEKVFAFLTKHGLPLTLKWIPEETIKYVNGFSSSIIEDKDNHDYIYDVAKIYTSKGNEFRHHRNRVKLFVKENFNINSNLIDITDDKIK